MSGSDRGLPAERASEKGDMWMADLEAYHDRELSWWRRRRVEAKLRTSPELRRELDLLRQMSAAAAISGDSPGSPDLWGAISARLPAIDAERELRAPEATGSTFGEWLSGRLGWKPIGLVVAAGAAALAIGLWNPTQPVPGGVLPGELVGGVLRYLDTGDKSVIVVDEEDVTIIWLIEGRGISDGA